MKIDSITGNTIILNPHAADLWTLGADLNICVNFENGHKWAFKILKGFMTDLRSGSHLINFFVPKSADHVYNQAVILHDANYTLNKEGDHSLTRRQADNLLEAMIDWGTAYPAPVENLKGKEMPSLKVAPWKTAVMNFSLKLFGGGHWETKKTGNSSFVMPMERLRWK